MSASIETAVEQSGLQSPPAATALATSRLGSARALLPLLSVAVFLVGWELAAASGVWNQTFVG